MDISRENKSFKSKGKANEIPFSFLSLHLKNASSLNDSDNFTLHAGLFSNVGSPDFYPDFHTLCLAEADNG
jgi:hypothetical protein